MKYCTKTASGPNRDPGSARAAFRFGRQLDSFFANAASNP
jgi:hypothetical protein